MYWPELTETSRTRYMTSVFGGLNHNLKINDGEWYDEKNLSASHYPLFSQRARRGTVLTAENPLGMLAKDALMYIDGSTLYFNGLPVSGVTLDADKVPKQMVSMGAYAVIFPDRVYVNTKDLTDCGSLDAAYTSVGSISYTPCTLDGAAITPTVSGTEPASPNVGDYWVDTSGSKHILKVYTSTLGWQEIATTYVKIGAKGIGTNFGEYDGVTVSGAEIDSLNGDYVLYGVSTDYVIVAALIDQATNQTSGSISMKREAPEMDYVCEANNRLWGCKYGFVDGQTINEIYACKLGDFKNWRCYMGLSTDSYAVSLGTDGKFTGAITLQVYPLFFKEGCIHKIYGSMPSQYQVNTTMCRGVMDGCAESLCIVNERLYYKSRSDVCVYDGSLPTGISDALGTDGYDSAAAGAQGSVLYISMRNVATREWSLFTYDTSKSIWHREDGTHASHFAAVRGDLLYVDADTDKIMSATGMSGDAEDAVSWSAESGMMGYEMADQKYTSRYCIRAKLGAGASITLKIEYDSDGVWHDQGTWTGAAGTGSIGSVTMPVIPRRCDHFRVQVSGTGDVKLYSIARYYEGGSDQAWR